MNENYTKSNLAEIKKYDLKEKQKRQLKAILTSKESNSAKIKIKPLDANSNAD